MERSWTVYVHCDDECASSGGGAAPAVTLPVAFAPLAGAACWLPSDLERTYTLRYRQKMQMFCVIHCTISGLAINLTWIGGVKHSSQLLSLFVEWPLRFVAQFAPLSSESCTADDGSGGI